MLPLTLLRTAQGHPMLVELKNGDTYNGRLVNCDAWMNINLKEVICTSRDGDRFWKLTECYIRGNSIKYLRIPEDVIDQVVEEEPTQKATGGKGGGGRGKGRLTTGSKGKGGGKGGKGGKGEGKGGGGKGIGRGSGGKGKGEGKGGKGGRGIE
mmetsp:Transcript_9893/g.19830  ORF Transcript_9893/g.19830 Transcript_9893/m.19830 type:complete len:153 (-) Transcript_9893:291-749(-)